MPSIEADSLHTENRPWLHIAVGVVGDADGRILISERKADCAYAGQWEFPGGKVETGEKVEQALVRELHEELGLKVEQARPLISIRFEYPDRRVLLDTWRITRWSGRPEAREGQRFAWVPAGELDSYPMLAANRPIVRAAQLPDRYLLTPDLTGDRAVFLKTLRDRLADGIRLVRLRQTQLEKPVYATLAEQVLAVCRNAGATLMLDDEKLADELSTGLHLTSRALAEHRSRPLPESRWLAASCHSHEELRQAEALGCDFAVVGAVKPTATHPDAVPLGWQGFAKLAEAASFPVYALGGMTSGDREQAWTAGGQGIAAIRGLWA